MKDAHTCLSTQQARGLCRIAGDRAIYEDRLPGRLAECSRMRLSTFGKSELADLKDVVLTAMKNMQATRDL
jgi:hypothetical protein